VIAASRVHDAVPASVALNRHIHAPLRQASMQPVATCCLLLYVKGAPRECSYHSRVLPSFPRHDHTQFQAPRYSFSGCPVRTSWQRGGVHSVIVPWLC
jgi:hypothetical protein